MTKGTWVALFLALTLTSLACAKPPAPPAAASQLDHGVFVEPLVPGVWRHVSYRHFVGAGPIPSNGLIVRLDDGKVLLIDTAWNDEQTSVILDWVEAHVGRVSTLVITHAHDDRMGGIAESHRREIESIAFEGTRVEARRQGWPEIERGVGSGFRLESLGIPGEIFYPGPGHSRDNIVVHLEDRRVLAGTCMIRTGSAQSLGSTAVADMAAWPDSVRAIAVRYPSVEVVVPGHGDPGGPELIGHTLELLEAYEETSP